MTSFYVHVRWILPLFNAYFYIFSCFVGWWKETMDLLEGKETVFIWSLLCGHVSLPATWTLPDSTGSGDFLLPEEFWKSQATWGLGRWFPNEGTCCTRVRT